MGKTAKDIKRYFMKSDSENYKHFEELHPPSKKFKSGFRRSHKAKAKQAVRNGNYEAIPEFKKCHRWNWWMDW
ncbi:hypothetical protein C4588_06080 [Candidatus Parcubacteria bacterium]|nr:MAG: hypothetical protein C4588_06080 [Candidatus Parcubacteria bacterium]